MTALHTVDTVVIGAGHAGLAVSRLLTEAGREHVVLDRGRVGERWRTARWDSLHLLTPDLDEPASRMAAPRATPTPSCPPGTSSDLLEKYAASFDAPVLTGTTVTSLTTAPHRRVRRTHRPRHVACALRRRGHRPPRHAPRPGRGRARRRARGDQQPVPQPRPPRRGRRPGRGCLGIRACRSPTSSPDPAATSSWRSGGTPGCRAATAAWTSSGGWSPPAGSRAPSTRCPTPSAARREPSLQLVGRGPAPTRSRARSTWRRCSGAASG